MAERLEFYLGGSYVGARDYQVYDGFGSLTGHWDAVAVVGDQRQDLASVGFGGQAGYYTDQETGLVLLGARYYDPSTGRFLNRDPMGYDGGINLYGFCGNNPVNESDPKGTDANGNGRDPIASPKVGKGKNSSSQLGMILTLVMADALSSDGSSNDSEEIALEEADLSVLSKVRVKTAPNATKELPNRTEAFNQARDFAGVPRSQQPVKQWEVGNDASRASNANYRYSPHDSPTWGRYYEYNTPTGRRVIAEHLSDGPPHFHAGMQKDDTVFSGFKNERYLKVPGQPKHIYYGKN